MNTQTDQKDSLTPPLYLTERIFEQVRRDLNPSISKVFSKLLVIHAMVAVVTLSVCPQFGFQVFGVESGLLDLFMTLGTYGCELACGSFFIGSSILAASLLLKPEELRKLRENEILVVSTLALTSMGFFILMGGEILLGLAFFWILGSMIAGITLVETVFALRIRHAIA